MSGRLLFYFGRSCDNSPAEEKKLQEAEKFEPALLAAQFPIVQVYQHKVSCIIHQGKGKNG